jgi:hypothetical protein
MKLSNGLLAVGLRTSAAVRAQSGAKTLGGITGGNANHAWHIAKR